MEKIIFIWKIEISLWSEPLRHIQAFGRSIYNRRLYVWGDRWDPSFCRMANSRAGVPQHGPIDDFPADVSPYGIEAMAGGVTEWTSSTVEGADLRIVKGGNWASGPTECRASSRLAQSFDRVLPSLGFRVARSAPR